MSIGVIANKNMNIFNELKAKGFNINEQKGTVEVKGIELSLDKVIGIAENSLKSKEQEIERIKQQLFSRDKINDYVKQCQEIVEQDKELKAKIRAFDKTKEDYTSEAENKYNEKMKKFIS